ncbi:ATP-dependent proteinase [Chthonomonas calidirosea]|uniref:Lon protease n=1 Tax=Chthonomonas calidirosea (strain DSM 23976 / ICMP 18418 / T49) TaxID=1303518 RepID=S0EUI9_CHTCT|nr:endopeptidase La [Chthonomonas calidirosea]CCW33997.1 ATP-dependent proteinase. Serine peptidase. MEROPS family S16 [Chthonomonas calidirosea T49]CEK14933.1 ATP-dependent proteinase [Chthonomonas calidirosea]CEK16058.1 ATP-dependent proteinase [Chthonomonas calidirosea]
MATNKELDIPFELLERNESETNDASRSETPPIPEELNLLPLREVVIFPMLVAPLGVGRESSVRLVHDSLQGGNRLIAVTCMKDPTIEQPTINDIYTIGTVVAVQMMAQVPEGIRLIVQGLRRFELVELVQTTPYMRARIRLIPEPEVPKEDELEVEALRRSVSQLFQRIVQLSPDLPDEMQSLPSRVQGPGALADLIAAQLPRISFQERQEILEIIPIKQRLHRLLELLSREVQLLELSNRLQSEVVQELGKTQREYYLREHLRQIQKELGEGDERTQDIEELRQKIESSGMPEEARKEAERELNRLSRMNPAVPEYNVTRTYLEWMTSMPWQVSTQDNLDIKHVKEVLDADHYGLDKVKDRILEYLSVRKFKTEGPVRQPILCFVGPPGVGKTSLGRSIAHALGRKFVRISLGGVHDEAEIRGHRRTYIGALPGQIIQGIRRAETNNPVFMLDEIDKVQADFRGDPSSALLEVLDPEQNCTFRDHYLDVPFDLSKVLFIATANVLDTILPPLRDRMEIIEIAGYTEEEKIAIAQAHLIPKQTKEHGIQNKIHFTPESVQLIVRGYTREAGVRNLEREIAAVCRKATRDFAEGRYKTRKITPRVVEEYLGAPRFENEEAMERVERPGVATGLAWTPMGGDILFVEATAMPITSNRPSTLIVTGQVGDVMRESAQAALSYVRAHAAEIGAPPDFYEKHDIHIHIPAGAIPKDGPSAGITMTVALASLFSGRPTRPLMAMTGEVTLSGKVLPVGGIKEKVLGARRAGIKTVLLPERNRKDLYEDLKPEIRKEMHFHFIKDVKQALNLALEPPRKHSAEHTETANSREKEAPGQKRIRKVEPIAPSMPA